MIMIDSRGTVHYTSLRTDTQLRFYCILLHLLDINGR